MKEKGKVVRLRQTEFAFQLRKNAVFRAGLCAFLVWVGGVADDVMAGTSECDMRLLHNVVTRGQRVRNVITSAM